MQHLLTEILCGENLQSLGEQEVEYDRLNNQLSIQANQHQSVISSGFRIKQTINLIMKLCYVSLELNHESIETGKIATIRLDVCGAFYDFIILFFIFSLD